MVQSDKAKEPSGKEGEMWEMETWASARSVASAGRRVCFTVQGRWLWILDDCEPDASSGYMLRLRVRVASQGGCPGKLWGLLHNTSQMFSPGRHSKLAPKGPFQPEPVCALRSLVRKCDHGESGNLHFRRREM